LEARWVQERWIRTCLHAMQKCLHVYGGISKGFSCLNIYNSYSTYLLRIYALEMWQRVYNWWINNHWFVCLIMSNWNFFFFFRNFKINFMVWGGWIMWVFLLHYVWLTFVTKCLVLFPSKIRSEKLVIAEYWCSWSHVFLC